MSQVQSHVVSALKIRSLSLQPPEAPKPEFRLLSTESPEPRTCWCKRQSFTQVWVLGPWWVQHAPSISWCHVRSARVHPVGNICTRLKLSWVHIARMMESTIIWYLPWEPTLNITDQRSSLIACQEPGCLRSTYVKLFAEQTEAPYALPRGP